MKKTMEAWEPKIGEMTTDQFQSIISLYKKEERKIGKTITIGPKIWKVEKYEWAKKWDGHSINSKNGKITRETWKTEKKDK